ncbi:MAG: phenylacetate--CoA ligase family protein [Crenarchaeota archaeon]|nr:phenylacetate--CoA ligase family protein [Thermoproteota archaeon]
MVNLFKLLYFLRLANKRLHWSPSEIKRYQNKRLRYIVKYAYNNVPFYRQLYQENGVNIDEINQIEDLGKLPVVKKEFFKKQDPQLLVSNQYNLNSLKKVRTSGSTGTPFVIYINSTEDAWRKAIYMRANIACGQKPKDRWVVLTAPTHFKDTTNIQRKLGIFAQNCVSLFETSDKKIQQVIDAKPDVLDGYSGSVAMLAREAKKRNIVSIKPHLVFGNAEFIDQQSRRCIEDVFNAPYCDQFGCAEIDRSAWQCLNREGYHMDVDSVITEFLDRAGLSVADDEQGTVTYTSLFNYAMPFIRYSIGDIGVSTSDTCSCGNNLPLMKIIMGRKDSFLSLPNNKILSPMVFNYAISTFNFYKDIDQYQIRQRKIDAIDINLKMNAYSIPKDQMVFKFKNHLKTLLEIPQEIDLNIAFLDEIPLSKTGKLQSVWSDISNT